jgi:uncharacterized protein (TIRG00374 family)
MKSKAGRIASSLARWLIAILGIAWVVSNLHWRDRVLVSNGQSLPLEYSLRAGADETSPGFEIDGPYGPETIERQNVFNGPDRKTIALTDGRTLPLLGMRLRGDINQHPSVVDLLVKKNDREAEIVLPSAVAGGFVLDVPKPRVQVGLGTMLKQADAKRLIAAVAIGAIPFLITTFRWKKLLAGLGIVLSFGRAFVLNMVGAFYNTFMPGSTGGDLLKAYYAAKQAPDRRTAAVMSVIVDRVLGLITLILLGGAMAGYAWLTAADMHDPVTRACKSVALGAAAIIACCVLGLAVLYMPFVRKLISRNDRFARSKAYQQMRKVMHVLHVYRSQPGLILGAILMTFPVHLQTVVSAMLAGQAFGLKISSGYYFVFVPVVVLAGAIPVSPQGVGVMEAFAYYFLRQQGATLNQALALTMSIRLVGIFWNLMGGLFVLRGGYHAPTTKEQAELQDAPPSEMDGQNRSFVSPNV